jgi:hypothetical protein
LGRGTGTAPIRAHEWRIVLQGGIHAGHKVTGEALEQHLQDHWDATEFAELGIELANEEEHGFPGRQVLTPRNTIDLLGYRRAAREWWVFELKKGRSSDAVVGEVQRYMGWMSAEAKPRERVRGRLSSGGPTRT